MIQPILHCPDPAKWLRCIERWIVQDGDCWRWTRWLDADDYGRFYCWIDGRKRETGAHRASWLAHRGDIPAGLTVDHLCRQRWCVNPWHMELVTHAVNWGRRGPLGSYVHLERVPIERSPSACGKHGREDGYERQTGELRPSWCCRICRRINQQKHRDKKKDYLRVLVAECVEGAEA